MKLTRTAAKTPSGKWPAKTNPNTNNTGTWGKALPTKSTASGWAAAARKAVGR